MDGDRDFPEHRIAIRFPQHDNLEGEMVVLAIMCLGLGAACQAITCPALARRLPAIADLVPENWTCR